MTQPPTVLMAETVLAGRCGRTAVRGIHQGWLRNFAAIGRNLTLAERHWETEVVVGPRNWDCARYGPDSIPTVA